MLLRWTAAGLLEAEKQFRRVNGYREKLPIDPTRTPNAHSNTTINVLHPTDKQPDN
jgi:hypothetical protein